MTNTTKLVAVVIDGRVAWEGEYAGEQGGWVRVREGNRIDEVRPEHVRPIDDGGFLMAALA
jgi:hypothetical protein